MAILKIARMGHPVLRRPAQPVADPQDPEVQRLIKDMTETMLDAQGAGLAAPQVYRSLRVILFHAPAVRSGASSPGPADTAPFTVLINPEITIDTTDRQEGWEGCLSIPGLRGRVPRAPHIWYRGLGSDGTPLEREATGFHARVVQHEVDHLDGVLYPDRMTRLESLVFESEWSHVLAEERAAEGDVAQQEVSP
ncbi:MAG: peptide deformylase [Alphaproteobacteria bacterium]